MSAPLHNGAAGCCETAKALRAEMAALATKVGHLEALATLWLGLGNGDHHWVHVVAEKVEELFSVTRAQLRGPSTDRAITRVRHTLVWVIRKVRNCSYAQAGEWFGYQDHTSVMNACNRVNRRRANDPDYRAMTDALLALGIQARAAEKRGLAA